MKKIIKKYKILIAIVLIFLAIIGISILFFIKSHEKKIFKAYMSDSTIIKYISKDNVIKTELNGTESIVYHNNKKVALLKNEEKNNTYIESYYLLDGKEEIYQGKSIFYKDSKNDITYHEYYNYKDEKIKTYYYENNKVIKIVFHTDSSIVYYKNENSKLTYNLYKKDLLYQKCYFDKTNTYMTYCEIYDRNNNITLKHKFDIDQYGSKKQIILTEKDSKTTGTYKIDNEYLYTSLSDEEKYTYKIQKIYLFGSKYLYNSSYIFNVIQYNLIKSNKTEFFYDEYEELRGKIYTNTENENYLYTYPEIDSHLNKKSTEYSMYKLYDKVKFKNFLDIVDYTYSSHIDNNVEYYLEYEEQYIDGHKIKNIITKMIDNESNKYFEGEYVNIYYDWFSEEEVSEEEFNKIMEEYDTSN